MKEIYHLHGIEEEVDHTTYAKKFDLSSQENFPQINYDPNFFSIIHDEYEKKINIKLKTNTTPRIRPQTMASEGKGQSWTLRGGRLAGILYLE